MKTNRPFENKLIVSDFRDEATALRHRQGDGWATTKKPRLRTKPWTNRELHRFEKRYQRRLAKMRHYDS